MGKTIPCMLVIVAVAFSHVVIAGTPPETVYTPEDRKIFDRYMDYIAPWQSAPVDSLLAKTALFFLESPYVAHTLEVSAEEKLVVNLREFDCTTFVESVIALARTASLSPGLQVPPVTPYPSFGHPAFEVFLQELQRIRYRNGNLQGYASRLHYIADWLYDNENMGIVTNNSAVLGGIPEEKTIQFMTTHRHAYRQLKDNDTLWQQIRVIEEDINKRGGFYYLPKANISPMASMIPHMSMVAFATTIKGLDVTHMGFTFQEKGRLTFIHASTTQEKVVIDQKTLSDYCNSQPSCTGIIVAKIN